jgi:alcohol dehydrogenase
LPFFTHTQWTTLSINLIHTFRAPRQIIFGPGVSTQLPELVSQQGKRVLLVTDKVVFHQPTVRDLIHRINSAVESLIVFSEATSDVPVSDVEKVVHAVMGQNIEVIVAIGGGTVIDLAKIVAVILTHGGKPSDYYGEAKVPGPSIPLIAVPTTAGTGSEVTPVSVLSDPDIELKVGVSSTFIVPSFAVIDPELTLSCPPNVTAYSGADAFCHAVESYLSPKRDLTPKSLMESVFIGRNVITDEYATKAARVVGNNLLSGVRNGADLEVRQSLSQGAMWAGFAFAHAGTGAPHAMQYPIGAATHTPHGLGVGLLLPYALYHIRSISTGRICDLSSVIDDSLVADTQSLTVQNFIDWTVKLMSEIGIPRTLSDLGVSRLDVLPLAQKTLRVTRLLNNHPGDTSLESIEGMLDAAWLGDFGRLDALAK